MIENPTYTNPNQKPVVKTEIKIVPTNITHINENYILQPMPNDLMGVNRGFATNGETGYNSAEIRVEGSQGLVLRNSQFIGLEQTATSLKDITIINNGLQKINLGGATTGGVIVTNVSSNVNQPDFKVALDFSTIKTKAGGVQTVIFNNKEYTPDGDGNVSIAYLAGNTNLDSPKKTINITNNSASTKYLEVTPLQVNSSDIPVASAVGSVGSLVNFTNTEDFKFSIDTTSGGNKLKLEGPNFIKGIIDTNGARLPVTNGLVSLPNNQNNSSYYGELNLSTAQVTSLFTPGQGLNFNNQGFTLSAGTKPSNLDSNDTIILWYGATGDFKIVPPSSITNSSGTITIGSAVTSVAANSKLIWHIVKNS
jgi:hypothetical protein